MFSKEMEALIAASIEDGILTEQEKRVLVKRAEKEGIDLDELEVYIQSMLQKQQKAKMAAEQPEENKRETWQGKVVKCPNCGAPIEPGIAKCLSCGYAFSGIKANNTAKELAQQLNDINANSQITDKIAAISMTISSFPIPTTKEDYLELMILLQTGMKTSGYQDLSLPAVYKSKLEECISKAQTSFAHDPLVVQQIAQAKQAIEEKIARDKKGAMIGLGCMAVGGLLILIFFICSFMGCFD
ncbi:putative uncharacterized protein [Prevotella sp. CAG:1092]|nr:putative uncharacterized protein [Prevotella sp. CAG:1092]